MKTILKTSILLNLVLLTGLIVVVEQKRTDHHDSSSFTDDKLEAQSTQVLHSIKSTQVTSAPFHWIQLESTNGYQIYINNLRAAGCPGPTVQDIVRGDVERAFAFERNQLGLDDSSSGLWSLQAAKQLEAKLLGLSAPGEPALPTQKSHGSTSSSGEMASGNNQPLSSSGSTVAQIEDNSSSGNENMPNAAGFAAARNSNANQYQKTTEVVDASDSKNSSALQSGNDSSNPNSTSADYLPSSQATDPLLLSMGARDYMIYEQQLYTVWFQNQIETADAAGEPLTINPDDFSK